MTLVSELWNSFKNVRIGAGCWLSNPIWNQCKWDFLWHLILNCPKAKILSCIFCLVLLVCGALGSGVLLPWCQTITSKMPSDGKQLKLWWERLSHQWEGLVFYRPYKLKVQCNWGDKVRACSLPSFHYAHFFMIKSYFKVCVLV